MENRDLDPMTILKLKQIHHCKKCFKKLHRKLLEVNGVIAASIDEEKKLVSVRGKVDPWVLIKAIEENGNTAELLSYEKMPMKKSSSESTASESESVQQNGREKKSYRFWKGRDKNSSKYRKERKEEEEHKIEDYEPQKIDPEVCRDPFCKVHKRRPIITSRVPSRDSENHPHHTGMGIFPGVHELFHQTNPLRHNYNPPDMEAPPTYGGFYSGRPAPHGFTFHGNGNPRNCNMM